MRRLEREEIDRLVAAWRRGSDREASFRRLAEAYYRPVHRFFVRRGIGEDQARDLTQQTFLGIVRGLADFRQAARFEAWLFEIAANVLRKTARRVRAHKRQGEMAMVELPDGPALEEVARAPSSDDPLRQALAKERRERLRQAIERLPARMRTCLALRVYQERSYEEIATAMGLTVDTVKAHLYQARRRLEAELAGEGEKARTMP